MRVGFGVVCFSMGRESERKEGKERKERKKEEKKKKTKHHLPGEFFGFRSYTFYTRVKKITPPGKKIQVFPSFSGFLVFFFYPRH